MRVTANNIKKLEKIIKDKAPYEEIEAVKGYVDIFNQLNIKDIEERSKGIKTVRELMGILTTKELKYLYELESELLEQEI